MIIKSDKIIYNGKLFDGYLYAEKGKITEISRRKPQTDAYSDYTGKYVSAGFIDMHTHGGGGHPFIGGSVQDVIDGVNFHLTRGTTSILPTVSAGPFDVMAQAVANIDAAKRSPDTLSNIIGAHLEGPYLSAKQCGAQCPTFITEPNPQDYRALIGRFPDSIARWTYAPENDVNGEFCRYLTEHGILASAGHTDAMYADMVTAIDSGCRLVTHLYSCTSTVTRNHGFRSLGVIESAFLRDELFVEIIADGKHLPAELIKMIVKIKGVDKVALITDSLEIAGTNVKSGVMSGTPFIVEDGVCKLRDRSAFAGSIATADVLLRVLTKECRFGVAESARMITEVPSEILGLKNKGKLEAGYDADIVVFDGDINVDGVFVGGIKRV